MTDAEWESGLALKLHGARRLTIAAWPALKGGQGHNMTIEEATANFPKEAGIARYGEPAEIAELMAFLVSPGARWMTGSSLRMDGGEVKSI
jgi:3-oxoacyl-[acyl-carrier protein] reductase